MNVYDTIRSNSEKLAADSQLIANAVEWFGADNFQVFIDQDRNNPPGEDDAPGVQFHSWFKQASEDQERVLIGYYLFIMIFDNDDATRVEENASEFSGTERLNWIIERALAVIRTDKPTKSVMSYEFETDTLSMFPAMVADVRVEFALDLVLGQHPFD